MQVGFNPNWVSVPGETISDILYERNINIGTFSKSLRCSESFVEDLLTGEERITEEIAQKLSTVLGASVDFWINRQIQYSADLERIYKDRWVSNFPIKDMTKFGWLPVARQADNFQTLLNFFDTPNTDFWQNKYQYAVCETMFRRVPRNQEQIGTVTAWLRQGEIEAENIECKDWNEEVFKDSIYKARQLTRQKEPSVFLPRLQELFSEAGVALVIVRAPQRSGVSGATRFISPLKAIMQLSFRYLSDDQFWFTLFHEAGHLILHKGQLNLELEPEYAEHLLKEDEADGFAADILIPKEYKQALNNVGLHSREIIKLARTIGVSPGIVVGQLQHSERILYRQFNSLKRRYKW